MNEERLAKKKSQSRPGGRISMGKHAFRRIIAVSFILGAVLTSLCFVLVIAVFGRGQILIGKKADQYRELDDGFGKYLQMRREIEKESLYDADDSTLDKELARSVLGLVPDKYAQYYTPEEYASFERKFLTDYSGIGVASQLRGDGAVEITRVIEDGPAYREGIKEGDLIVSIDGRKPKTLEEASELMLGDTGTKLKLVISRDGEEHSFTVYREQIEDKSVTHEVYNSEIAYIKVATFREGTAEDFEATVKDLKTQGFSKFIIDLRGNSGGITQEGIDLADSLLPACRMVTVRNRKGEEKVTNSDAGNLGIQYAIAVDGETASASEIVVGAVKANRGGVIVGSRTYGKGVIQSVYKLKDGSVFKLTTDEYILPDGEAIDEVGIEPDVRPEAGADPLAAAAEELD